MAENKQTQEDAKQAVGRKTAPAIIVAENLGKNAIDQLLADNPGHSFVRVPAGSSKEALAGRGLEPVMQNGKVVERKGTMVARCIDETHSEEVAASHAEAASQVSAVRKLDVSDSQSFKKTTTPMKGRDKSIEPMIR